MHISFERCKKLSLDPKCFLPQISQQLSFYSAVMGNVSTSRGQKSIFSTLKYFKENTVMQSLLPLGLGQWWSMRPWKAIHICFYRAIQKKQWHFKKSELVVAKDCSDILLQLVWLTVFQTIVLTFSEQERSGWCCRHFFSHAGRSFCWSSSKGSIEDFVPGHWMKQMEFVEFIFHQFQKG